MVNDNSKKEILEKIAKEIAALGEIKESLTVIENKLSETREQFNSRYQRLFMLIREFGILPQSLETEKLGDAVIDEQKVEELKNKVDNKILYSLGICAETGEYQSVDTNVIIKIAKAELKGEKEDYIQSAKNKETNNKKGYGVIFGIDANDLSQAGWGIVFPEGCDPEIKQQLEPLLKLRKDAAKTRFRILSYKKGENYLDWVNRHKVAFNIVDPNLLDSKDPNQGLPFYLLLVGSPEDIPFEFQYDLDLFWAVGRLYFDDINDYGNYAKKLEAYETAKQLQTTKNIVLFAPTIRRDIATELFTLQVALALKNEDFGRSKNFTLTTYIGNEAKKDNLLKALNSHPAILFTGSHGAYFNTQDPDLIFKKQGAILCQEWKLGTALQPKDYFSASDVPNGHTIQGLIHLMFGCYGVGCPQYDDFEFADGTRRQIAPKSFFSHLPQKLLASGALAVLGHIDRAWSYSFLSSKGITQLQPFKDVLGRLLDGNRIGYATDQFDINRAAITYQISGLMKRPDSKSNDEEIAKLWIARNDSRNYIILGDPAVQLRIDKLI